MIISSLLGGFFSFFTPAVILYLILIVFAFVKIDSNSITIKRKLLVFGLVVLINFLIIAFVSFGLFPPAFLIYAVSFIMLLINLFFGLWLIGVFDNYLAHHNLTRRIETTIVVLSGFVFAGGVIPSIKVIWAGLILSFVGGVTSGGIFLTMFSFVFGLMLPVILTLFLIHKALKSMRETKWFSYMRIIYGVLFIISTCIAMFIGA